MFGWLKRKPTPTAPPPEPPAPPIPVETMRSVFEHPAKVAAWLDEFIITPRPWRENFAIGPDADAQRDLEITFEQRERLAKEHTVLQIAGMLLVLKQHKDDGYYQAVLSDLTSRLVRALEFGPKQRFELGQALDLYVNSANDGKLEDGERQYLTRMYDDNPNYFRMKLSGIGGIATSTMLGGFEILRDIYYEATQGMKYATFVRVAEAIAKIEADKSSTPAEPRMGHQSPAEIGHPVMGVH